MKFFLFVAVFLVVPFAADAHTALEGSDGFIAGLQHPFADIRPALAIVAIGLFFGQHRLKNVDKPSAVFLAGLLAGLATALAPVSFSLPDYAVYSITIVSGVLIALALRVARPVQFVIAAVAGLLIGVDLVPDPASFAAIAFTCCGSLISASFLYLYAVMGSDWLVSREGKPWLAVGLRVLGSWIAAVAILMIAFALRV